MQIIERDYTRRLVRFAERFALVLLILSGAWPFVARSDIHIFRLVLPTGGFHGYDVNWLPFERGIHAFVQRFGDSTAGEFIELYSGIVAIGWFAPLVFLLGMMIFHRHPAAAAARLPGAFLISLFFKVAKERRADLMLRVRPVYLVGFGLFLLLGALVFDLEPTATGRWLFELGKSDILFAGIIVSCGNCFGASLLLAGLLIAWRTANVRLLSAPAS